MWWLEGEEVWLLWRLEKWEKRDYRTKRTESVGHKVNKRKTKWRKKKKKKKRNGSVGNEMLAKVCAQKSEIGGKSFFLLHFASRKTSI